MKYERPWSGSRDPLKGQSSRTQKCGKKMQLEIVQLLRKTKIFLVILLIAARCFGEKSRSGTGFAVIVTEMFADVESVTMSSVTSSMLTYDTCWLC